MIQASILCAPLAPLALAGAAAPDLSRYYIVCAGMLAAIGVLAFGFRRLMAGALRSKAARRSLQVLDVLPLGGRQKLAVVRCYDRTFALGLGEREVNLVAELDPIHGERARVATEIADSQAFASALERARTTTPSDTAFPERADRAGHAGHTKHPEQATPRKRLSDLFRGRSVFG